jgi:molybdate transport system substrate-binding protein
MRPERRTVGLAALLLLAVTACGTGAPGPLTPAAEGASGQPLSGRLTVFAAASLTGSFERLRDDFAAAHPGVQVQLNLGASSALARQIVSGAPADVFAAANPPTMATVVDAREATAPQVFARNRLQLVVPADGPGRVDALADLARPELVVALCAVAVPCGEASARLLSSAGVTAAPDTLEQDVKAVLTKVALGEVDAGLVYRTDVLAGGGAVRGIDVPQADQVVNDYLVAVTSSTGNPSAARAFVAHLLSPRGQAVLREAGFELP